MEAVRTSETSVDNYFTLQYIPEDNSEQHTRRLEDLKCHLTVKCLCGELEDAGGCWKMLGALYSFVIKLQFVRINRNVRNCLIVTKKLHKQINYKNRFNPYAHRIDSLLRDETRSPVSCFVTQPTSSLQ
jgi:hypothetical protein